MAFLNAGITSREHARMGVTYLQEVLEAFKDLDGQLRLSFQCSLAELHWKSGNQEKAEQSFKALIKQNEQRAIGYIGLADALTVGRKRNDLTPAYQEALDILEQARNRPVSDGEDFDLDKTIAYMRDSQAG